MARCGMCKYWKNEREAKTAKPSDERRRLGSLTDMATDAIHPAEYPDLLCTCELCRPEPEPEHVEIDGLLRAPLSESAA